MLVYCIGCLNETKIQRWKELVPGKSLGLNNVCTFLHEVRLVTHILWRCIQICCKNVVKDYMCTRCNGYMIMNDLINPTCDVWCTGCTAQWRNGHTCVYYSTWLMVRLQHNYVQGIVVWWDKPTTFYAQYMPKGKAFY